ncbi:MAG: hypothetical protein RLZZ254_268 [Actinomycetota bacterium]
MTGVEIGVVRQLRKFGEAAKEIFGISARKIGSATSIEENRVTRNQSTVDHETLTAWCVAWRVEEADSNVSDIENISAFDELQRVDGDSGGLHDPLAFVSIDEHGHGSSAQDFDDSRKTHTHHSPSAVVGVIMRNEDRIHFKPVIGSNLEKFKRRVSGIDHRTPTRSRVADQIGKVAHLVCHLIVAGKIASGEQLSKVEIMTTAARHVRTLRGPTMEP